jgi:hypothetical protein
MSYLNWKAGDRIVCIKRGGWRQTYGETYSGVHPKYGEICTISRIVLREEVPFVFLEEYHPFNTYKAENFRPVQPRQSDISIFTAMLNPKKQVVDA